MQGKKLETSAEGAAIDFSPANFTSINGSITTLCRTFDHWIPVACPVVVTEYIKKNHHVRVRPIMAYGFTNSDLKIDHLKREEFEIPVHFVSHGGYTIEWPYFKGDTGWVLSSDFDFTMSVGNKHILGNDMSDDDIDGMVSFADTSLTHELCNGVFFPDNWSMYEEDSSSSSDDDSEDSDDPIDYSLRSLVDSNYEYGNYIEKRSKEFYANWLNLTSNTPGNRYISLFSSVGDDDIYDDFYQQYLLSNTCGISLDMDGGVSVYTAGKCKYEEEESEADDNYELSYNRLRISDSVISLDSDYRKKDGNEYESKSCYATIDYYRAHLGFVKRKREKEDGEHEYEADLKDEYETVLNLGSDDLDYDVSKHEHIGESDEITTKLSYHSSMSLPISVESQVVTGDVTSDEIKQIDKKIRTKTSRAVVYASGRIVTNSYDTLSYPETDDNGEKFTSRSTSSSYARIDGMDFVVERYHSGYETKDDDVIVDSSRGSFGSYLSASTTGSSGSSVQIAANDVIVEDLGSHLSATQQGHLTIKAKEINVKEGLDSSFVLSAIGGGKDAWEVDRGDGQLRVNSKISFSAGRLLCSSGDVPRSPYYCATGHK